MNNLHLIVWTSLLSWVKLLLHLFNNFQNFVGLKEDVLHLTNELAHSFFEFQHWLLAGVVLHDVSQ